MNCRYCNNTLSPLRSLTDGEFCSDEHRTAFRIENPGVLDEAPTPVAEPVAVKATVIRESAPESEPSLPVSEYLLPLEFQLEAATLADGEIQALPVEFRGTSLRFPAVKVSPYDLLSEIELAIASVPEEEPVAHSLAETDAPPATALAAAEPAGIAPPQFRTDFADFREEPIAEEPRESVSSAALQHLSRSWTWVVSTWKSAPMDLKVITLFLPIMLAVAVSGSKPHVPHVKITAGTANNVEHVVNEQLKSVQQNIANRAAVAYTDDFRSGLDSWDSRSNLTTSWSYDATGFVQPGPLAVFKPSMEMSDYHFGFLGEIDRRAMGFVVRATDLNNYWAVKFVVTRPGPLPVVSVVRYAVINGKEGPHVEKPLPIVTRADMLYRVMVDVHGNDFTVRAQDQLVDFWSDNRLAHGGIGFFCSRGEKARLRWVEVSHQYDTLGRLCAFVAPYAIQSNN